MSRQRGESKAGKGSERAEGDARGLKPASTSPEGVSGLADAILLRPLVPLLRATRAVRFLS